MSQDYDEVTFVKVWQTDSGLIQLEAGDEPIVAAAMKRHLANPGSNELIEVTTLHGNVFKLLISTVTSWMISNPESREREREWDKQVLASQAFDG